MDFDQSANQLMAELNEKQFKMEEIMKRIEDHVHVDLMKFLQTHDTDLVKQFFTNTVLTPTETAHIVAKANLHAHQMSGSFVAKSPNNASSSTSGLRRSNTSISPYRQTTTGTSNSHREATNLQFRKTTPTRKGQKNTSQTRGGMASGHTPSRDFGNSGKMPGESVRLQELQSNTDQLFGELRRANDRYMEQQVENRRLKDQVQVLQLQIEDLRIHNNRYQMQAQSY